MEEEIKNNIVIYEGEGGKIELRADIEKDTLWTTQKTVADLFDCSADNVSLHLKNIFSSGELDKHSVTEEFSVTASDGKKYKVKHYNLDAIIAVGYRVNSKKATQFRIWATGIIRNYLVEGHAINRPRLEGAPEKLVGLYKTIAFLESKSLSGKLKGKITLKLTEDMESTGL
ncbi:MAG: virulence RhuM family protein [Candidatus Taylorbacteria bacterium]|nr:virulence RhuM family protein [Candidatus Taylorbacteria bacterium]